MVGFRRERNTTSVPYRSNEMGIGFRDDVNYFNLDPITAGPQVTSYLDFSNFVPSYVPPPPPPPAPVYNPYNNGGGNGDGDGNAQGGNYAIGNTGNYSSDVAPSGWGDSAEASQGAADDDMGDDDCLLYTSPSPRDRTRSRMPSSA